jgi:hypothetical protein
MSNQDMFNEMYDKTTSYKNIGDIPGITQGGKWISRATCRRTNDGVDDTTGMALFTNGHAYDHLIFWLAVECHDPFSVETVNLGAAGKLPANDAFAVGIFKSVQKRMNQTG